ncbi:MAG: hypothetical protein H0W02_00655 [Ktedonobacteraceae bacterium]|nr:hypothetical protein [Ktedonobacteraceae bacterium]
MYTAERQRAQPYLARVRGPLYEQWYLLHHRMVRVVTDHRELSGHIRSFLYYAELLAEYTYEHATQLPVEIPEDLLWQAGARLHRPIALTCYLFETGPLEEFPPEPGRPSPESAEWEEVAGVEGPQQTRWKDQQTQLRFRAVQAHAGVTSRISWALHKKDLHATVFIEEMEKCQPWFVTRFAFYMVLGSLFGYDGFEIIHAGAVALEETGALVVGSSGSGKSTLVLSCLRAGMTFLADDVVFLGRDDDLVHVYAFPEDIGVCEGTFELLHGVPFMESAVADQRFKRHVDTQHYFGQQIVSESPVRVILFIDADNRDVQFRAEQLSAAQAVSMLMQEYVSQQRARAGGADAMFDIFSDMMSQAAAYQLWLTPDVDLNAAQVLALMERHLPA